MGGEPPEPVDEAGGAKPQLNAGSLVLQGGAAHIWSGNGELFIVGGYIKNDRNLYPKKPSKI